MVTVGADGEREFEAFARKVDAEAHRDAINAKLQSGSHVTERAGRVTVGELHEQWLGQQAHTAAATRAKRESAWAQWVRPKWGASEVKDVQRSAVRAWVAEMVDAGAQPATVENAVEALRMVLGLAVEDRRIAANPAGGVKLPPREHRPRAYLTHEQVWQLADAIGQRYRTLVLLLAYTGLRFGEAAALEVRDLDFLRRRIEVRQQVTEVRGTLVWTPTKGKRRRSVPFPKFLAEPLSLLCADKGREDRMFTAPKGGPLRLTSWRRRAWQPVIDALCADGGFPDATPHDLRHTAASLAISAGANVKAVQTMLGHMSASMTLDTYADLFPADLDSVAVAFDAAVEAMTRPVDSQSDQSV